ncbi:MAG: hypothetical protein MHMPM18_002345 [Marteilia pararefringens]
MDHLSRAHDRLFLFQDNLESLLDVSKSSFRNIIKLYDQIGKNLNLNLNSEILVGDRMENTSPIQSSNNAPCSNNICRIVSTKHEIDLSNLNKRVEIQFTHKKILCVELIQGTIKFTCYAFRFGIEYNEIGHSSTEFHEFDDNPTIDNIAKCLSKKILGLMNNRNVSNFFSTVKTIKIALIIDKHNSINIGLNSESKKDLMDSLKKNCEEGLKARTAFYGIYESNACYFVGLKLHRFYNKTSINYECDAYLEFYDTLELTMATTLNSSARKKAITVPTSFDFANFLDVEEKCEIFETFKEILCDFEKNILIYDGKFVNKCLTFLVSLTGIYNLIKRYAEEKCQYPRFCLIPKNIDDFMREGRLNINEMPANIALKRFIKFIMNRAAILIAIFIITSMEELFYEKIEPNYSRTESPIVYIGLSPSDAEEYPAFVGLIEKSVNYLAACFWIKNRKNSRPPSIQFVWNKEMKLIATCLDILDSE